MFPPEYIDIWRKRYGWTDRQTFLFQYERPMQEAFEEQPESYTPEEISQAITNLLRKEIAWTLNHGIVLKKDKKSQGLFFTLSLGMQRWDTF